MDGGIPRLYQLPAPPADFTGREGEMRALAELATACGPALIMGLFGMGGVGKTALALKLAEEIAPQFPDGQIFIDLGGGTTSLSPAQAMAHVVRSFLPEARLPAEPAELAALYRSVLHGKRALLLMDNAAGPEQVEPLLPPRGSALLLTSRLRFTLPGLASSDVEPLPPEDARELLRRIDPRIGDATAELVDLCGGLPLALRLVGSALSERPDLAPSQLAERLKQGASLGPVDAALGTSYGLLPEDVRPLWPLLAVFPATFDAEAAFAMWQLHDSGAEDAMGKLVAGSLLEWKKSVSRYFLPAPARSFAQRQLKQDAQLEASRRHASYYLEILRRADSLYQEGGEESWRGLGLLDAELANILAGQAWAAAQPPDDAGATALCDDYPIAGRNCLDLRLPPRERIRWLEAALASSRRRNDLTHEASHLGGLGNAYGELGDLRRAVDLHEQSLALARKAGDRRREAAALGNLANACSGLGDIRRAIDLYQQHLVIDTELGDRRWQGRAFNNLGAAYLTLGEHERAITFLEQSLAMARETGDLRTGGDALGNLGLAHESRGEVAHAIELFQQHLAIERQFGDRRGEAIALGNLGRAYSSPDSADQAIDFFTERLAIVRGLGDLWGEAYTCWDLGQVYVLRGEVSRAAELMQVLVDLERDTERTNEEHIAELKSIRDRLGGTVPGAVSPAAAAPFSPLSPQELLLLAFRLVAARHASPDLLLHFDAARLREAADKALAEGGPLKAEAGDPLAAAAALLAEELPQEQPDPLWLSWIMRSQSSALQHLTAAAPPPPAASTPT